MHCSAVSPQHIPHIWAEQHLLRNVGAGAGRLREKEDVLVGGKHISIVPKHSSGLKNDIQGVLG